MSETGGTNAIRPITSIIETHQEPDEVEIDLMELLYRLMDKWKWIVLGALLGTVVSAAITLFVLTPKYEATAKLYVLNSNDSAVNLSDLQIGSYLATDYQEVFRTWEVHEMVIANLGLFYTYQELQEMLSVTNPPSTRILYITITSESPREAAALANEYASVARKYISSTMATEQPNNFSIALEPTKAISPNKTLNIILGFLIGVVFVVAIITVLFILDDKIRTNEDILKYAGMPTLAMIPAAKETKNKASAGNGKRK